MKNIKETIIKKQYVAVIFFLGLMLVMVIRMGKNIKTSEIKSSIEMKTQDELGEKFAAEYIGFNMDDSASESGVETEVETVSESEEASDYQYPSGWLDSFSDKVEELKQMFPSGKYWNHMDVESDGTDYLMVTDIPCNHTENGEAYCNLYNGMSDDAYVYKDTSTQCWGFASYLSDYIFGSDAAAKRFYNYDSLRVGDQARIQGDSHTVFILEKTDDYVIVAECNDDYETCMISCGRKIMREDLQGYYITRWN